MDKEKVWLNTPIEDRDLNMLHPQDSEVLDKDIAFLVIYVNPFGHVGVDEFTADSYRNMSPEEVMFYCECDEIRVVRLKKNKEIGWK